MPYKGKDEVLQNMLQSPAQYQAVLRAFIKIVADSFLTDRNRVQSDLIVLSKVHDPTKAEIKHRTDMCYDLFMVMRHDLHWSTQRSLDELPHALRTKLDGGDWTPQTDRQAWGVSKPR